MNRHEKLKRATTYTQPSKGMGAKKFVTYQDQVVLIYVEHPGHPNGPYSAKVGDERVYFISEEEIIDYLEMCLAQDLADAANSTKH